LLGWSAQQLADVSKVGIATIWRAEKEAGEVRFTAANAAAIRNALQAAGIEFIAENGGGVGVRLRKRQGE
jgi:transcriptional regulator with XRE-family HTH domain